MKRTIWWVLLVFILGSAATYYYWQQSLQQSVPPPTHSEALPAPSAASAAPAIRHPLETDPARPLPVLGDSDAAMWKALAGLLGTESLTKFFYPDLMIRRIVATIDNLPRKKAPVRMMPVKPVPQPFARLGTVDNTVISPGNSARYTAYVKARSAGQKIMIRMGSKNPLLQ